MNLQQILTKHPNSNKIDCFDLVKGDIPDPSLLTEEQVIVQTKYISIDATNKVWISGVKTYMEPIKIGEVMKGLAVGEVVYSKSQTLKLGDLVLGLLTWQLYGVFHSSQLKKVPKEYPHHQHFVGLLGISGLTAYIGLKEVGEVKEGDTLVVSAAAGAVGELVVQFGKLMGAKVVGLAGSEEKCKYVEQLGAEYCINYKKEDIFEALKKHCSKGVDVYFDNVGGEILETVINFMNIKGRIALCGAISEYGDVTSKNKYGIKNLSSLIGKRIKMQGFIVLDYAAKFDEIGKIILGYLQTGKITFKEDITDGLENAPKALEKLLNGENNGKTIIRIVGEKANLYDK
jgi:hypothetical protein